MLLWLLLGGPESHFPQPGKSRIIIHNGNEGCILAVTTDVEIKKSQRHYKVYQAIIVLVSKYCYPPFLEGRSDKGNIR